MLTIEEQKEAVDATLRWYCRHLVGLAALVLKREPNGAISKDPQCLFYSGFIISIRDTWYFGTAGHVVKDIDKTRRRGFSVTEFNLVDCYGLGATYHKAIPFDYDSAVKRYVDNKKEGLDYAFLALRPYYRRLLEANGVVAVAEDLWPKQDTELDKYFLIGLPGDTVEKSQTRIPGGCQLRAFAPPRRVLRGEIGALSE